MQPYEIRQLRDGTIDYNNYVARPVSLLTPSMHRFCLQAVSAKSLLLMVATMAATIAALALIPILAADRAVGNVGDRATTKIQSGVETTAAPFRWPAGPRPESTQGLRERVEILANCDPRQWWDGYGKSTTRGQAAAIADLQKQLGATPVAMAMR